MSWQTDDENGVEDQAGVLRCRVHGRSRGSWCEVSAAMAGEGTYPWVHNRSMIMSMKTTMGFAAGE